MLELKQEGDIFFIIKLQWNLYLTHIDGKEIEWNEETLDEKKEFKELFDLEGNLKTDPLGFYDTISQLLVLAKRKIPSYLMNLYYFKKRMMKNIKKSA